jgi:tryptophan-rich sensory protein
LAVAAGGVIVVAVAGGLLTEIGPWYRNLKKPAWQPPDWAFGPAWTTIFTLVALSAAFAWRAAANASARSILVGLFVINGVLNVGWSLLFFAWKRPDWALIEVIFLWLSIAILIVATDRYSTRAGVLLLPYLMWVSFAAFLNYTIVQLNGPF